MCTPYKTGQMRDDPETDFGIMSSALFTLETVVKRHFALLTIC
jgi:hypothetical protein